MSTICTDTTALAHANKDDEEYFRAFGTLPFTRIEALLDAQAEIVKCASAATKAIDDARDGLPCEDFAEDIVWSLEKLRDDEHTVDAAMSARLQDIITALGKLQADLFQRAEKAMTRLHDADEALSDWVES